jgi:hypothetical protein
MPSLASAGSTVWLSSLVLLGHQRSAPSRLTASNTSVGERHRDKGSGSPR